MQIPGLHIQETNEKGRGVFSGITIEPEDIIEVCPVIVLPQSELTIIHKTSLHDYYFLWGENNNQAAIALGFGSLYNHSQNPNATFIVDVERKEIIFQCIKLIEPAQEIFINYHEIKQDQGLWFNEK